MMTKDDGNWSIDLEIFHLNSLIMKLELKLELIINQKCQGWTCFIGNLLDTICTGVVGTFLRVVLPFMDYLDFFKYFQFGGEF